MINKEIQMLSNLSPTLMVRKFVKCSEDVPPVGSGVLQQTVFIAKMLVLMPDVIFATNRADSVFPSLVNCSSFSERSCADLQL